MYPFPFTFRVHFTIQGSDEVALAAIAALFSLLVGRRLPSSMAFFAQTNMAGSLNGRPLNKARLEKLRTGGVRTVVMCK